MSKASEAIIRLHFTSMGMPLDLDCKKLNFTIEMG